jgi:hypothetical protein
VIISLAKGFEELKSVSSKGWENILGTGRRNLWFIFSPGKKTASFYVELMRYL